MVGFCHTNAKSAWVGLGRLQIRTAANADAAARQPGSLHELLLGQLGSHLLVHGVLDEFTRRLHERQRSRGKTEPGTPTKR